MFTIRFLKEGENEFRDYFEERQKAEFERMETAICVASELIRTRRARRCEIDAAGKCHAVLGLDPNGGEIFVSRRIGMRLLSLKGKKPVSLPKSRGAACRSCGGWNSYKAQHADWEAGIVPAAAYCRSQWNCGHCGATNGLDVPVTERTAARCASS